MIGLIVPHALVRCSACRRSFPCAQHLGGVEGMREAYGLPLPHGPCVHDGDLARVPTRLDPATRMPDGEDMLASVDDMVNVDAGLHRLDSCRKEAFGLLLPSIAPPRDVRLTDMRLSRFLVYGAFHTRRHHRWRILRFTDVQDRSTEFLDFTSVTLDEFQQLVPPFEAAFQSRMAAWRMDGKPRTARRFTVYKNCPLPTPEDRLFFILTYLKTYSLQVVQGRLFGMGQSKANQWIHVLLPALLAALRTLGEAPTRSLAALAQRLGVAEAAAATMATPLEDAVPGVAGPAAAPASPLLPMTGRNDGSSAPKTLLHRRRVIAGRKKTTR